MLLLIGLLKTMYIMKKSRAERKGKITLETRTEYFDAFSRFLSVTKHLGCECCYLASTASDVADWMVQVYHFPNTCVSANCLEDWTTESIRKHGENMGNIKCISIFWDVVVEHEKLSEHSAKRGQSRTARLISIKFISNSKLQSKVVCISPLSP